MVTRSRWIEKDLAQHISAESFGRFFFHIYSIENKSCIGFCYWSKLLWNKKYPFTSCKFWAAILLEMLKRNAEWRPTTDHVNRQNKLCCYYISTSLPSFFLSLSVPPPPLSMCYCCSLLLVAVAIVLRIRILVIFEVKSRIKLNLEAFCWWCCWCGCLTTQFGQICWGKLNIIERFWSSDAKSSATITLHTMIFFM